MTMLRACSFSRCRAGEGSEYSGTTMSVMMDLSDRISMTSADGAEELIHSGDQQRRSTVSSDMIVDGTGATAVSELPAAGGMWLGLLPVCANRSLPR